MIYSYVTIYAVIKAVYYLLVYLIIVSFIGVVLTLYDKYASKKQKRRIREATLFLFALIGAALPMFITMKLIRHKTLHKSFMLGFPIIAAVHILLLILYFNKF